MACSKAEDLINQLIEATLKLLDFGLNIMDALRVQKLLTIRNQKIGLISDDACLPECSLRFSLNFDLMMFNKLLRNACLRARATLNELRVCRLRYPNAPLVLEAKTKMKFQKLQKKIRDFDDAVRSDKMIARRDLRDFREISIIFSQLEHDLKLLICSLECASTMKDTVLFAAPITDVMTVLSIVLSRLERLAQKAEIDEKIAVAEQQKTLQEQNAAATAQSNSAVRHRRERSAPPSSSSTRQRRKRDPIVRHGQNSNRTSKERRQEMNAMIAAAAASQRSKSIDDQNRHGDDDKQKQETTTDHRSPPLINVSKRSNTSHFGQIEKSFRTERNYRSSTSTLNNNENFNLSSSEHYQNIDREEMKEFRHQWINQWTDQARQMSFERHRHRVALPSFESSSQNRMKTKKKKKKKLHHQQQQNNSAVLRLQTENSSSNDDESEVQCRIS